MSQRFQSRINILYLSKPKYGHAYNLYHQHHQNPCIHHGSTSRHTREFQLNLIHINIPPANHPHQRMSMIWLSHLFLELRYTLSRWSQARRRRSAVRSSSSTLTLPGPMISIEAVSWFCTGVNSTLVGVHQVGAEEQHRMLTCLGVCSAMSRTQRTWAGQTGILP